MLSKKNKKKVTHASIVLLIICISLVVLLFFQKNSYQTIVWQQREKVIKTQELYTVSNGNNSIFISSFLPLDESKIKLKDDWFIKKISTDEFWDPTVCAKMPSVLIGTSTLFFKEVLVDPETHVLKKIIYKYSLEKNIVSFYDISDIKIIGDIYKHKDSLYYFNYEKNKNSIYINILSGSDFTNVVKKKVKIPEKVTKYEDLILYLEKDYSIYFTYFGDSFKSYLYGFDFETLSFIKKDKVEKLNTITIKDNAKYVRVKNTKYTAIYGLGNVYNLKIIDGDSSSIVTFDQTDKSVKYVIDAF